MMNDPHPPGDIALTRRLRPGLDPYAVYDSRGRVVARVEPSHPQRGRTLRIIVWAVNRLAGTRHFRMRQTLARVVSKIEPEEVDEADMGCAGCGARLALEPHREGCAQGSQQSSSDKGA